MSKELRLFVAFLMGIVMTLLVATPDPEGVGEPITNPVVLVITFVVTAISTLRIIRKVELLRKEDWME